MGFFAAGRLQVPQAEKLKPYIPINPGTRFLSSIKITHDLSMRRRAAQWSSSQIKSTTILENCFIFLLLEKEREKS